MADTVEGAGFWLPSEFLDDFLMDKENLNKTHITDSDSDFCFPSEFPYDFETESDEHLRKSWVLSTSPQSTLARLGSWSGRSAGGSSSGSPNGVPSPPTSPLGAQNDAVGDVIYRAAGQVAKLKLTGGLGVGPPQHKIAMAPPPSSLQKFHPEAKNPNPAVFQNIYSRQQMVKPQMYEVRSGMGQDAWRVQQNPTRITGGGARAVSFGGAAAKRGCAGTGVFLPRRYVNNNESNADSHKKPGHSAGNGHTYNMNVFAQSQPKFNRGFVPEYDMLMARRNTALLLQHQRNTILEGSSAAAGGRRGMYLPQEWTY